MKRIMIALIGVSFIALLATPAFSAENVCGKRDDIVARLESGYQEFNSAMGMSTNGGLVELYTSDKGTWTLMLSQPNGVSCLIAAGENWESFNTPKSASQVY
jgi:hypothetical protein